MTLSVWMEDALTDIWNSTTISTSNAKFLELNMAKNEYESGQVAIRSSSQLTQLQVIVGNLVGPGGAIINGVTAHFVGNVHCRANSGPTLPISMRFTAPAEVPVYFRKESIISLPANTTISAWLTVQVPSNIPVGRYSGSITISSDQGSDTCELVVNVFDVLIPEPNDNSAFYNAQTFNLCGIVPDLNRAATQNKEVYGYDDFTPEFWTQVKNIAAEMKQYRMNVIYVPIYYLLRPDMQIDSNGNYIFDWSKFDQFIQTFIDYGSVKLLEGATLLLKRIDWDTPYQGWIFTDSGGAISVDWRDPYSTDYTHHLDQLLTELNNHLHTKGWHSMWAQSVGDEALTAQQLDSAKIVYQKIKSIAPGMKTIDACNDLALPVFGNLLDIYIPRLDAYESEQSSFDAIAAGGSQIWQYTSSGPQGSFLQRMEDYLLPSTRLLPWYSFKHRMKGYLNWGYNLWVFGAVINEPYTELCSGSDLPGDPWVVYPDVAGKTILNGPRIAALRDGSEEYELLNLYAVKSPAAAKALVDTAVVSATVYDLAPATVLQRKIELLLGAANSVKNAGFEEGNLSDYFGIWNAYVVTSIKHRGSYSLQLAANDQAGIAQYVPVKPSTNYVMSAYVITESNAKVHISVSGYGGPSIRSADCSCASWQKVIIEFKTSSTQTAVDLHVLKSTAGTGHCYVDDIEIREKPEPLALNHVTNPGFETGNTSGYFGIWNASVVTTDPYSGSFCLKIDGASQGGIAQYLLVQPNRYYRIAAYVKTTGTDTVYLSLDGYGGASVRTIDVKSDNWQLVLLEFKTGPAQTAVDIRIIKSTQNGGDCYVDDIELRERLSP